MIGSQAILAAYSESELPPEATVSIEADIAFFDDSDDEKADRVDGAIGEASMFHSQFGYYGQGVGRATATLPEGWEDRLLPFEWGRPKQSVWNLTTSCSRSWLPGEKDREFADALIGRRLVDPEVLLERVETLPVVGAIKRRVRTFVERRMENT